MLVARVPDQAIFDSISLVRIGSHFMDDHQECIGCWRLYGLLAAQNIFPTCNHHSREQALDRADDGVSWRYPVKCCQKRISMRHGNFFEKLHLNLWQILGLACSAGKSRWVSVANAQHELKIGNEYSIVDWNQYCRDIAVSHFINNLVQKSLFSRKKYNRRKIELEHWSFGGSTKESFLLPVPRRNAATLTPVIIQWVRPETENRSNM